MLSYMCCRKNRRGEFITLRPESNAALGLGRRPRCKVKCIYSFSLLGNIPGESNRDHNEHFTRHFWKMMKILSASFLPVVAVASVLALSVYVGFYNSVNVELGFEHYAERANSTLGGYKFPVWMKMPGNTLVNVGYIGVGFLWLLRVISIDKLQETDITTDFYMVSVFAWMAIIYGFTQFARIVNQSFFWAVLDQWFTLPFFCWTVIWSRTVQHGWKPRSAVLILVLSVLSYNLALLHKFGFDVALGVHIAVAFWHGCKVLQTHFTHDNLILFLLVLFNCCGFVFLKLGDFHFAKYEIFQELTGHFWSKICDFLQIHFVIKFFLNVGQKSESVKKVR